MHSVAMRRSVEMRLVRMHLVAMRSVAMRSVAMRSVGMHSVGKRLETKEICFSCFKSRAKHLILSLNFLCLSLLHHSDFKGLLDRSE